MRKSVLAASLIILLITEPAWAMVRTVDDSGGKDFTTIQACVNAMSPGDTCLVYPGRYPESVNLDGKQGTPDLPIIVKCLYPAVMPLLGGAWADSPEKRCEIDGEDTRTYGIGAPATGSGSRAVYVVVDGFYIHDCRPTTGGGRVGGILFLTDYSLWIRNVRVENCGNTGAEDDGAISIDDATNVVIQNPILRWTEAPTGNSLSALIVAETRCSSCPAAPSPDHPGVIEFAELRLETGIANRGTWYYLPSPVSGSCVNAGLINRYNFVFANALAYTRSWRQRDCVNQEIAHNFVYSTSDQAFVWIHENDNDNKDERHQIHHNTFLWASVMGADGILGLQYQGVTSPIASGEPTRIFNNIFEVGAPDNSPCIESGFGDNTNTDVEVIDNVWHNCARLVALDLMAPGGVLVEVGSLNIDAQVNPATGCATAVDNATYGANLDVSTRPWKTCDGQPITPHTPAFFSAAGLAVIDPKPAAPTGVE